MISSADGFNPRTPRGVRHGAGQPLFTMVKFQSTHPSRGATDYRKFHDLWIPFQSTHPSRGATRTISVGSQPRRCFNPRTPRGVRRIQLGIGTGAKTFQSTHPSRGATGRNGQEPWSYMFQSTHPSRGATIRRRYVAVSKQVSIHAPLAGCDNGRRKRHCKGRSFNPRTPRGVRHMSLRYRRSGL